MDSLSFSEDSNLRWPALGAQLLKQACGTWELPNPCESSSGLPQDEPPWLLTCWEITPPRPTSAPSWLILLSRKRLIHLLVDIWFRRHLITTNCHKESQHHLSSCFCKFVSRNSRFGFYFIPTLRQGPHCQPGSVQVGWWRMDDRQTAETTGHRKCARERGLGGAQGRPSPPHATG